MAANKILEEFGPLYGVVTEGFKYNLQVLPDVLTAATILFGILFQSPPTAILGTAMILMSFIHMGVARFFASVFPDLIQSPNDITRCSGRFPGVSYGRLLGLTRASRFGALSDTAWPSYYTTFVGFLAGWVGALPQLYREELNAAPNTDTGVKLGAVILTLLCIIVVAYRVTSECETFSSTLVGLLSGFSVGLALVLIVAFATDRRGTNMLGLPLFRSKAEDGKPIYVCERSVTASSKK
jgi:hypothetical protein